MEIAENFQFYQSKRQCVACLYMETDKRVGAVCAVETEEEGRPVAVDRYKDRPDCLTYRPFVRIVRAA